MIEVKNLSKFFGTTAAIKDVTFSVREGEILGFLGPNGAGKTTTMRILAGYIPASSGTAKVGEYEVHRDSLAVRKRIGYLPERPPLYLDMTVKGFLEFVTQIKGVPRRHRARQVKSAIERCFLEEKSNTLIRKLSKGYRQRVGIAQAIVHDPPVIILDEPTIGLDPRQMIEVRNLIKSLAGDHTIILSTHILSEVNMISDRVSIIANGVLVTTNTPEHLMTELAKGGGYTLTVAGNTELVQGTLNALPEVSSVQIAQSENQERSQIQVTCLPHTEPGDKIATVVVNSGLHLYEMQRDKPTLEDVFLELTAQDQPATTTHSKAKT
ncbi:MAG: ATP-binding cassette domain-containing protein [Cyanobacteria bacterium]|jgi:ABC-2 type transport system ATP-binding protein|nr:ATP-binding cassette domain-containing protein [Cyanobacteria bacterium GSL.Bin1]